MFQQRQIPYAERLRKSLFQYILYMTEITIGTPEADAIKGWLWKMNDKSLELLKENKLVFSTEYIPCQDDKDKDRLNLFLFKSQKVIQIKDILLSRFSTMKFFVSLSGDTELIFISLTDYKTKLMWKINPNLPDTLVSQLFGAVNWIQINLCSDFLYGSRYLLPMASFPVEGFAVATLATLKEIKSLDNVADVFGDCWITQPSNSSEVKKWYTDTLDELTQAGVIITEI